MTDPIAELLRRLGATDDDAEQKLIVDQLWALVRDLAYGVARARKLSVDQCDDVAQTCAVKLVPVLIESGERVRKPRNFVRRSATHAVIDVFRRQARHACPVDPFSPVIVNAPGEEVLAMIERAEQRAIVRAMLDDPQLPENYRDVIVRMCEMGQTAQEIANDKGVKVGTVDRQMRRAGHWLRRRYQGRWGDET